MKNIQKQYTDLLEGKMSKQNFMRNVRMEFPQHVTNVSSFEDAVKILKGKRIISEATKPEGVYGHNPNAETPPAPGIDQLNYYQVYHGIQYELAQMPEITDEAYIKARKKVVDTILKDPDAYKQLQLANFKAVKAMDQDLKMKEVKENNLTDKPNEMKVVKKDAKANTEDTLGKKERKKAKAPKGVAVMTQTPKKAKGIAKVMEVPGKEKVKALKENIMQEMTRENPTYEHFQVGARVKKKDNSLVGEITEWDGDTATIKTDEGEIHHVQGNILTKGDIPAKEDTTSVNPKAHVPEDTEKKEEGYMGTSYDSSEDMAVDMVNKGIKEERASKLKSLKEKLMKVVREVAKVTDEKGTVVALKANAADAQEFVQGQETAVKSKLKVTA